MKVDKCLHALLLMSVIAAIPGANGAAPALSTPASSFGTIVGIVTDAAKRPVAGATVTAVRTGGGIRSAIAGSDGVYSFADVPPWLMVADHNGRGLSRRFPDVLGPAITGWRPRIQTYLRNCAACAKYRVTDVPVALLSACFFHLYSPCTTALPTSRGALRVYR